ncbi:ATP-dependent helicase [Sphingobacterium paramultivorum]|uniref:DNA 3'-5' helicase n=1 Tax=Sphingobacterium paramultivorum TaxID=2886510 RepID=A0A7G5E1Q1_9SPHI|nr:UvrD-helicase domain-containing protein [Sphingobacterium paramultivorum]QMV67926.1 ATP-dependent helicase [Sphingobacterium paramultivorum]WSO16826.1 UvrD-helicase domain-containing protein [Sphingobacterium paramultivorum]
MVFENSEESEAYLNARGKIVLNACPGSGKTTNIIRKLPLLEAECKNKYGNHAGIACLSFTNVAKDEILQKYRKVYGYNFRYPNLVSTIDSFINQYITLPYYSLLEGKFDRPNIIDEADTIDKLIATKFESKGIVYETIASPANRYKNKLGKPLYRSYEPSTIWIDARGNFSFKGKIPDPKNVDLDEFNKYALAVFEWKMKNGFITSLDSAYFALQLLNNYPQIGVWLVTRFPYIIIDEAQDNSEIQHAIFDKLLDLGLRNLELIGDPYQSLYEWRDAKPQLFANKFTNVSWTGLLLTDNRRSVQRIINFFSLIRCPNDARINSLQVENKDLPIFIYKYTEDNVKLIVSDFENRCREFNFSENHIVVRGKKLLRKIIGEGSEIAPWKGDFPYSILLIKHLYDVNSIKEAINELRKLFLKILHPEMKYGEMQQLIRMVKEDVLINAKLYEYLSKIPPTNQSLITWSNKCIQSLYDHFDIDVTELFIFKKLIKGYKMADLKNELVDTFFNKPASSSKNIPVTTIHKIKGATLDAILYFLDETGTGESVGLNSFVRSTSFPNEKQRMIYVACSRPKQLLAIGVPHKTTEKELKTKFGGEIEIITL